jgi:hypothetical protein
MTIPPELPEEPNPFAGPPEGGAPIPPPPPMPHGYAGAPEPAKRYDHRKLLWTAGIVVLVVAVATWIFPPVGLLVPVILFVSLFFLFGVDRSVAYRSVLTGLLLGLGLGLIVTAGLCTAIFSGSLSSPLFNV